ncbi:MAG: helix-turn-helix domain-containing protein [Methyloligellaceae bacterium]
MNDNSDTNIGAFPVLLKTWRQKKRLSQLELSLAAGLSQRHLSFLETGRANPSRYAVAQLGEALEMPAAEVDAMLIAAGFASRASNERWSKETREAVSLSIDHVLAGHEPYPAVAIDRMWTLQKANTATQKFFARLGGDGDPNLLRGIMKPGAVKDNILNWDHVCRSLIRLYELEVARRPNDTEARQLLEELRELPGVQEAVNLPTIEKPAPILALEIQVDGKVLKLFSMIATIGMSADAALDDMRIETLLPADELTRMWFVG